MLKKERQKKYFNKVWKSLIFHLKAYYESKDPVELHRIRVQIKKINALLHFFQGYSKWINPSDHFEPVKSIFRHAGEIRSGHINLGIINKYGIEDETFKAEQHKILQDETEDFDSKEKEYIRTIKKARENLSGNFHNIEKPFIKSLVENQVEKLTKFFSKNTFEIDKLHKKRKQVKELLYLLQVLQNSIVEDLHLKEEYLDEMQETIGKWHDVFSLLNLLKDQGIKDKKTLNHLQVQCSTKLKSVKILSEDFGRKVVLEPPGSGTQP